MTAVRASDSSVKQTTLPHGVESMAAVPTKGLGPANTEERKAFIEHLVHMICKLSKGNLLYIFYGGTSGLSPAEDQAEYTEKYRSELERCLQKWRDKVGQCECHSFEPWNNCLPCITMNSSASASHVQGDFSNI